MQGNFALIAQEVIPRGECILTLRLLQSLGYDTSDCRSKSWDEFTSSAEQPFDFVFTVCDNAAAEVCPLWPGQPMTAHWGVTDPAAMDGSDAQRRRAFLHAYSVLESRIELFSCLPLRTLDRMRIQESIDKIGSATPPSDAP